MRYVIVGTGEFSNTYVAALKNVAGAELVGCVSRSGRRPDSAPHLESWQALAQVERPFDAVIIATPNGLHHEAAIEAARLGKHVLTEKPLHITVDGMNAMMAACAAAGVTLGVAYQRRVSPDNFAVKSLLSAGALGRILAVDLSCKYWRSPDYYASAAYRGTWELDGGGPFMQQACHLIDLYQWYFGMPIEVKSMLGRLVHDIEVEDHGAALLRHEGGMIGSIIASTALQPASPSRLEVHCEKGFFSLVNDRIVAWEVKDVENPSPSLRHAGPEPFVYWTQTSRHEAILRDFEAAVAEGRPPIADAPSARRTTELILQIYGGWPGQ